MNWGQIGVRESDGEGDLGAVLWNVTEKKETPASLSGVARVFLIHFLISPYRPIARRTSRHGWRA